MQPVKKNVCGKRCESVPQRDVNGYLSSVRFNANVVVDRIVGGFYRCENLVQVTKGIGSPISAFAPDISNTILSRKPDVILEAGLEMKYCIRRT